jgi:death-on-curing protein
MSSFKEEMPVTMSLIVYFLEPDEVIEIHDQLIAEYGGDGGLFDLAKIESTLASAKQTFEGAFLNKWPFEMAASIFVGLANNHGFVDGNKRTASFSANVYLIKNGYRLTLEEDELVQLTMDVVNKTIEKGALAELLERNCVRFEIQVD